MRKNLYATVSLITVFLTSSVYAEYPLSAVCEKAVMDTMRNVSHINLGDNEPYYIGLKDENSIEFTGEYSQYKKTYNAPILKVTFMYEDSCIGEFSVHNGQESCFISAMSYECR